MKGSDYETNNPWAALRMEVQQEKEKAEAEEGLADFILFLFRQPIL